MNFEHKTLLVIFLVLGALGCGQDATNDVLEAAKTYESTAVCAQTEDDTAGRDLDYLVYPRLDAIGPSGNELVVGEQYVWIVESGSNTVRRVDKFSGKADANFIDLGNDRNPYQIFVDEAQSEMFIANFSAHSLSIADLERGKIIDELKHASLKNPSDVTVTARAIYVSNVNYLGSAQGYGAGSITVIDRKTRKILGDLPTAHKNPQYITQIETVDGPRIAISNGGALRFGADGVFVESEGSVELWHEQENLLQPDVEVYPLGQIMEPNHGAPGRVQVTADGRSAYVVSGISPVLFKLDLAEKRWIYAAENPLKLYDSDGATTHSAVIASDDLLYIASFNQDALYVFDTSCDAMLIGSIDLGTTGNMLEGPQSIALDFHNDVSDVYFLMSISNVLGKVTVRPKN